MSKVIVLNSGGFDSTVLLHWVKDYCPADEYHSLFFSYGQISNEAEKKCSFRNAEKLWYTHHEISLPKFDWTESKFYDTDSNEYDSQFLEYRNLVFLSYAFSLAKSIGAEKIFMAVLKSPEGGYLDCSKKFFESVNSIDPSIEVVTPFSENEKYELAYYAFRCGITLDDFNSCDTPHNGKPCGKCNDCQSIKNIEFYLKGSSTPTQAFLNCDFDAFKRLSSVLLSTKDDFLELRVILNNDCQLSCPHCFHGFDELKQKPLSIKEWEEVVMQSLSLGFNSLHFGGKEPLFDSKIIDFLEMVKKVEEGTGEKYKEKGVVTNGINFLRMSHALKEAGLTKVYFSVDEALGKEHAELHNTFGLYEKNILKAFEEGLEVEVFVDLHDRNYNVLPAIFDSLAKLGVKKIHVRTVRNVGKAESIPHLTLEQVDKAVTDMEKYSLEHKDINLEFNMGIYYTYSFLRSDPSMERYRTTRLIFDTCFYQNCYATENFLFMPEIYCGRFLSVTTITTDGYALGCGCEVCYKDYDRHSVGNVRDKSLLRLSLEGRERMAEDNEPYFYDRSYSDCLCKV